MPNRYTVGGWREKGREMWLAESAEVWVAEKNRLDFVPPVIIM